MTQAPDTTHTRPDEDVREPSVLAVVVTHSGRPWLTDCLVSLATQTYGSLDVLVVDDASPDHLGPPALKRVVKRHLRRRRWGYLRTPRPLGFGGAINWALSRVRTDADLLLFMHDDAALTPISVEKMVQRVIAEPTTAIVGPKIVNWEDESILEEVGMAADRYGYPYKGLEPGEIDLGQHDRASDVFFVTSTCMLVKHSVFRKMRGWDARMRAFSEDLDLCWRARLAGHSVRFEPEAKARHAIALATGQRPSPFLPIRYFIRRNRLRTVSKNASGLRLLLLVPQFFFLALAEMAGFVVLRQPREILNIAKALGWNAVRIPQTLAERRRVQKRRRVPDVKIRKHTVRLTTRIRSYAGNQAQRLEEAWGRRAEVVARRGTQARAFGERMKGWPAFLSVLVFFAFLIGFRHVLWSGQASVAELLPFPERATGMWRAFISPWNSAGLGGPGPNPPAFAILGAFPILTLGAVGAAQKLLILGLGAVAAIGAYHLVFEIVDRPARFASGVAYAFGAAGYAGLREGRLGAMFFAAAAPWVLAAMIRMIGWSRPPNWRRNRAIARIVLGGAISAAFVPGSLALYAVAAVMLTIPKLLLDRGAEPFRPLLQMLIALVLSWALLLPWSFDWWATGGPMNLLTSDGTWRVYAESFRGHGMSSTLLGQTPDGPPLFGLALPILGFVAVAIGRGTRRRMALALWTVIVAIGWLVDLFSAGVLRPLVPSPTEAGVLASLAFAGLVGLGVGAFRMDLAQRQLGWIQAASLGLIAFSAFLMAAGIGPALWRAEWTAGRTAGGTSHEVVDQVSALLDAEAQKSGAFRALWVGTGWISNLPAGARTGSDRFITGARSPNLTDLFPPDRGKARDALDLAIASIEEGATDRGGELLGAFNINFVILERGPKAEGWLAQRDLALFRSEPDFVVLRNQVELPRAAVYDDVPVYVRALNERDPKLVSGGRETMSVSLPAVGRNSFELPTSEIDEGLRPGVIFLASAADDGWEAAVDDEVLSRADGGWGNAFELPAGMEGRLAVSYPRPLSSYAWLLILGLAWAATIGGAFSRKRRVGSGERRERA